MPIKTSLHRILLIDPLHLCPAAARCGRKLRLFCASEQCDELAEIVKHAAAHHAIFDTVRVLSAPATYICRLSRMLASTKKLRTLPIVGALSLAGLQSRSCRYQEGTVDALPLGAFGRGDDITCEQASEGCFHICSSSWGSTLMMSGSSPVTRGTCESGPLIR
jgi:hypothetical protein